MRPAILRIAFGLSVLSLTGAVVARGGPPELRFPHTRHERLFPVCEGCHAGVVSGVAEAVYPDSAACARCHDGTRRPRVVWDRRAPRASNLRFSHPEHRVASGREGKPAACLQCHAAGGVLPSRMTVASAAPSLCVQCHAHRADTHLAGTALCGRCHLPLAAAPDLDAGRIARFPKPSWHETADWVSTHGAAPNEVSCGVCHARETCERCHANAERVPRIAALARDARVAAIEATRSATYPTPRSHSGGWVELHGSAAADDGSRARCANCHTRPSCQACHRQPEGRAAIAIGAMPQRRAGRAPGVDSAGLRGKVHAADFQRGHGALAASSRLQCESCHAQRECSACHAGSESRAFHAANFVERHAVDVFTGGGECQSCHSTETFCRACHARAGIASSPRMNAAFHTGQSSWLLAHGQAARMGMEACASCHRQNDCTQCHSAAGGWGVNPHGPGFEASTARNAAGCKWCHTSGPTGRQ